MIQLRKSDPAIPFTLCRRQFAIKIAFAATVRLKNGLLNMLQRIHHPLFFPLAAPSDIFTILLIRQRRFYYNCWPPAACIK